MINETERGFLLFVLVGYKVITAVKKRQLLVSSRRVRALGRLVPEQGEYTKTADDTRGHKHVHQIDVLREDPEGPNDAKQDENFNHTRSVI